MNTLELRMLEMALKAACPGLELRKNEPMDRHTSFRVGGRAALMALPKDGNEAELVVRAARTQCVQPFFLGTGSDLLVSDKGYDGLIVKTEGLDGIESLGEKEIQAESGVMLSRLAHFAGEKGLSGLEFASGIPGSLGGAVLMNAGAYGGEMAQVVSAVTYLNDNGEKVTIPADKCGFSYRHSLFSDHPNWLILGASLELTPGDPAAIKTKMAELAAQRRDKQPLEYPSAGSTFKRPAPLPDGTPVYAAALIDQCGCKGLTVGGAQVSEKHAGFIINRGGAACADILELMDQVKKRVYEGTGILLEPEVKLLGMEAPSAPYGDASL